MSLGEGFFKWSADVHIEFLSSLRKERVAGLEVQWYVQREAGSQYRVSGAHGSISSFGSDFWRPEINAVEFIENHGQPRESLIWGFAWTLSSPGTSVGVNESLARSNATGAQATGSLTVSATPGGVGGAMNFGGGFSTTNGQTTTRGSAITQDGSRVSVTLANRFYRFEARHHRTLYEANHTGYLILIRRDEAGRPTAVSYKVANERFDFSVTQPYRPRQRQRPQQGLPACCEAQVVLCNGARMQAQMMCRDR